MDTDKTVPNTDYETSLGVLKDELKEDVDEDTLMEELLNQLPSRQMG